MAGQTFAGAGGGYAYHGGVNGYLAAGRAGVATGQGYARPPTQVAGNRYDAAPHYYRPEENGYTGQNADRGTYEAQRQGYEQRGGITVRLRQ